MGPVLAQAGVFGGPEVLIASTLLTLLAGSVFLLGLAFARGDDGESSGAVRHDEEGNGSGAVSE